MSNSKRTVLVVRHNALGDLVVARPALLALRRHFPDHRIVMTCPSNLVPLAEHLAVADAYVTETPAVRSDPTEHESLDDPILTRLPAYIDAADVIVVLRVPEPNLWKVLADRASGRLIAYRHTAVARTADFPEFTFEDHILLRWERMISAFGVGCDNGDLYFDPFPPTSAQHHTLVHIGAGSPARRWPLDRWGAVVRGLEDTGHHVLLTGSPAETEAIRSVIEIAGLPADRDLSGGTSALALAELVGSAALLVCTDTGISWVATALRRPSVTLFGPTPPQWWGPPVASPSHRTIWKGRLGEPYADTVDPGLLEISVRDVLEAIDTVRTGTH